MGQIMEALGSWAKNATYKMYMCVFYMYYVFFSASFKGGPPLKEALNKKVYGLIVQSVDHFSLILKKAVVTKFSSILNTCSR